MKILKKTSKINISFLSISYRFIGNLLIGKPESFGQRKDFYDIPIDREMPSPKKADDQYFKENIKTDFVRRKMFLAIGKFSALFSILFFGIFIFLFPYMGYYNPVNDAISNFKTEQSVFGNSNKQSEENKNQKENNNSLVGGSSSLFN